MSRRGWRLVIAIAIAMLVATPCFGQLVIAQGTGADNIQLLYFHRTERCQSCNNAEQFARETLDAYYPDEVKAGKIAIQSIDYQKDKAASEKYGVKMQGLKLLITKDGQQTVKDVPELWALVKDKSACIGCLKSVLDRELGR